MIDTIAGAEASAIIYSIAETAKANNLKPYDYFEYLLTEIPKHMDDQEVSFCEDLLPWLLYEKILPFNDKIKEYYVNKLKEYASINKGVYSYPDHKVEAINQLVIYILVGIANENDIEFMKEYAYMSDYLEFIFNPESFDYRKIKISDIMWCNFINSNHYRERILEHKSEFWNKEEEKRIELGFGSSLENRVAYKYLFD